MNTLSSIYSFFDPDYTLLPRPAKVDILSSTMLFVFRLISAKELTSTIQSYLGWSGAQGIEFRTKILAPNGTVNKCLKFYIYEKVVNGGRVDNSKYEVSDSDVEFVSRILKLRHQNIKYLVTGLTKYAKESPPRSLEEFNRGIARVYPELELTTDKYISKKFRWLETAGQMERDTLRADMVMYAVYAIYRAYPQIESLMHMKNIGTRAIHNRGVNILKEQSTQKRQRMVQNNDGTFSGSLLSIDHRGFSAVQTIDYGTGGNISVCNHMMSGLDGKAVPYERPTDVDRGRDLKKIVENLELRVKGLTKPKAFVRLLMGIHDEGFSKYLGTPNDEAIDTLDREEYVNAAIQYLKIPVPVAKEAVIRLRSQLADFRN
jgi:hypothetical protein